ncbi:hypothetical protein [Salinimonas iocasae]|uniref:Uncharacterized protein n=1 Tax=Salinimonas iocasae TaxID=2572577 RepID=A0A5B7YJD5_9ALTE|nr:hypothetical protein [Salinimonas iocasae]QCZ95506.1 hypothetical protein FBQ74_18470 [Salinimonas iocasae]
MKAAKNYNESVAKLKKESSEHLGRYEKLRSEVSDVLGFIQGNGKRKLYFSILEYDKQKRPGGSLISGIVLDKIHHLNRPIPPTPPPSNDNTPYLDRQQLKEQNPMH